MPLTVSAFCRFWDAFIAVFRFWFPFSLREKGLGDEGQTYKIGMYPHRGAGRSLRCNLFE